MVTLFNRMFKVEPGAELPADYCTGYDKTTECCTLYTVHTDEGGQVLADCAATQRSGRQVHCTSQHPAAVPTAPLHHPPRLYPTSG